MLPGFGKPLDLGARRFFEPRFGHSFASVRIHDDSAAGSSAATLGARAYTIGSEIVFGRGEYRPESAAGRHLLAHELAHVVQQSIGEPRAIQRELIWAGGFDSPYASDPAAEIQSFGNHTWAPSSDDFLATSGLAEGGPAAVDLDQLLAILQSEGMHSITDLGLIGHAVKGAFVLSGTIRVQTNPVMFGDEGVISTKSVLASNYLMVRDRFAPGAKLTLYGCNSGADQELLDTLSQAFGVCVHGFKGAIDWCIASNAAGAIMSRGQTKLASAAPAPDTGCNSYGSNIHQLAPDAVSCAGAPSATPTPAPQQGG